VKKGRLVGHEGAREREDSDGHGRNENIRTQSPKPGKGGRVGIKPETDKGEKKGAITPQRQEGGGSSK